VREAVGAGLHHHLPLSMLDLVEGGSTWDEVVELAQGDRGTGATIINTGIGWHEARIPTIATMVPRAAFAWVTRRLKGAVKIPLVTTNRINTPEVAEAGAGARRRRHGVDGAPLPGRRRLRQQGRRRAAPTRSTPASPATRPASTTSSRRLASCLVNPRACHETELTHRRPLAARRSPSSAPARRAWPRHHRGRARPRGDAVRRGRRIGGQFNSPRIPGKEEFAETLRYFRTPHGASSA
jgi:2,4-dienoyl-CoA reductase (NADPH2)